MPTRRRQPVSLAGGVRIAALPPGAVDATSERLGHAVAEGSAIGETAGARRLPDPFDTLHQRQSLDRDSPAGNDLMWQAGLRFRRHWHGSRFDNLTGFDFSRESVDGGPGPQAMTPTEAAVRHRTALRRASDAVGGRLLPYLQGVVIEQRPAGRLIRLVSDTAHARTAEAIVVERLREALHRLVDHWGMAGGRPSRAMPAGLRPARSHRRELSSSS